MLDRAKGDFIRKFVMQIVMVQFACDFYTIMMVSCSAGHAME
jgi:hypothetical protein